MLTPIQTPSLTPTFSLQSVTSFIFHLGAFKTGTMTLNTFKVHLVLKAEKMNRQGLAPIFAKIWLNGRKAELSTNRSISPASWNPAKECGRTSTPSNKELPFGRDRWNQIQNKNQYLA